MSYSYCCFYCINYVSTPKVYLIAPLDISTCTNPVSTSCSLGFQPPTISFTLSTPTKPPSVTFIPSLPYSQNVPAPRRLTLASHVTAAMGRSSSTPGLVESSGKVPLEEMWMPSFSKSQLMSQENNNLQPLYTGTLTIQTASIPTPCVSPSPSQKQKSRYPTLESERHTTESVLSDSSSRHSHSTDEEKQFPSPHHYTGQPVQSARSGYNY
ncbi:hypothetical protein Avbf_03969 [Armadillidium vulgare]|nr:hypothetical protein Avbf_03969 [Armadillidium vulgare]